jgi:hypothetical protein
MAILERDLQNARTEIESQRRKLANGEAALRDLEERLAEAHAETRAAHQRAERLETESDVASERAIGAAVGNGSGNAVAELAAARQKIDELNRRIMVNQVHYDKMRETLESLGISIS